MIEASEASIGTVPMRGIFLGYMARKPWRPAPTWDPDGKTAVIEACSVSECLCERPPEWVKRWDFNQATCQESAEAAREAVPLADDADYSVFAYWVVPAEGEDPDPNALPFDARLPALPAGPGPEGFEELGFDVVGLGTCLPPFEHSPLTCNSMALEERVNRWCLIDELDRARALAASWSAADGVGVEPGRYYVVRVAREPSGKNPPRVSME